MENNEDNKPAQDKPLHWKIRQKMEREAQAGNSFVQEQREIMKTHVETANNMLADAEAMVSASGGLPKPELSERDKYKAEVERIRKTRKPFGAFQQKLVLSLRPGYHRHWFNDIPGRVDEAVASGWTHVEDKDGRPVKRIVGSGRDKGALYAYAMEIPDVFWEEDQAELARRAKAPLDAIKSKPIMAKPGESRPEDDSKFYSPREHVVDIQRR